jgi:tetratricopeptide (TPR) repeat protein
MKKRYIIGIVVFLLFAVFATANTKLLIVAKDRAVIESADLYLAMGNQFYERGNTETAMHLYERGIGYEPENEFVLNNMGYYYHQQGEDVKAEEYLLRAVKADQYYERARMNLAVLYHDEKRYDEAVQQLIVLKKIDPNNPSYHYDLGINLAGLFREQGVGNLDDAIAEFVEADRLSPGYAKSVENIEALKNVKKAMAAS